MADDDGRHFRSGLSLLSLTPVAGTHTHPENLRGVIPSTDFTANYQVLPSFICFDGE